MTDREPFDPEDVDAIEDLILAAKEHAHRLLPADDFPTDMAEQHKRWILSNLDVVAEETVMLALSRVFPQIEPLDPRP